MVNLILGFMIFAIIVVVAVVFMFTPDAKKKKVKKPVEVPQKDWSTIVERLEKHTETQKKEIEGLEKELRNREKEVAVEKLRTTQLQNKLAQEKSWREKEQGAIDKRSQEIEQSKKDLLKVERTQEEEHAARLRLERENTETKRELQSVSEEKRKLTSKLIEVEASLDHYMKESAQLKKENIQLHKKSDETTWVAKADYEKLEKVLKEKEKELERIKRESA